ncbi:YjgN family protein [Flavobacterium oreochromis]|uniref:DUF898 domain-containing protein n=2 Tax=Flavobacterium TaxID=237 RepID=A0A246GCU4_9FLAO|nr:DUF898 family protein [Flavobacterium oreochromis]OWP78746.1 hypothetical protein BWG23_01280 [Flavobacterium oreochromis]OWP78927.1 hypothetical protein BWK62_03960 [Flavobacterium oreochromis]QYS87473.1 DUF898 domain-containing protein [Flavobacterium oreochromis]
MDQKLKQTKSYQMNFDGKGETFFGIIILNWVLSIITLGFYYPWAKEKRLKYLYSETILDGSPFEFHGTGKEMFKGFLVSIAVFLGIGIIVGTFYMLDYQVIATLLLIGVLVVIVPFAIHGSYRYRMSKTSWRGIRFGYRGKRNELIVNFLRWMGLTVLTLGFYGAWFTINLRRYIIQNIRFGDIKMDYKGNGGDYFVINIKGYILTLFTLGIYGFWWQKDIIEYYVNNLKLHKGDDELDFTTNITGGGIFKFTIVNILILMFTLGLGAAWVEMRMMKFLFSSIQLEGTIDLNTINQTEEIYKDATGEDIEDLLDIDLVI